MWHHCDEEQSLAQVDKGLEGVSCGICRKEEFLLCHLANPSAIKARTSWKNTNHSVCNRWCICDTQCDKPIHLSTIFELLIFVTPHHQEQQLCLCQKKKWVLWVRIWVCVRFLPSISPLKRWRYSFTPLLLQNARNRGVSPGASCHVNVLPNSANSFAIQVSGFTTFTSAAIVFPCLWKYQLRYIEECSYQLKGNWGQLGPAKHICLHLFIHALRGRNYIWLPRVH